MGVHESHCCLEHGCKYGDEDCPVATGLTKQLYDCEWCSYDREDVEELDFQKLLRWMSEERKRELLALLQKDLCPQSIDGDAVAL